MTLVPPASAVSTSNGAGRASRDIRLAALRVPLALKLVGANLAVVIAMVALADYAGFRPPTWLLGALVVIVIAHVALVMLALHPIRDLENVAQRVWGGDYGARVGRSSVADAEVLRVGSMFNILLDDLAADRTRMRELARDVIDAGDRERASIARALQDSTAQHIAALQFELSSAARDAVDPALAVRLRAARDAAEGILEEVRKLSRSVHPAVLDDLGLEAALRRLARDATSGTGVDVDVDSRLAGERLPHVVEVTLYRVASEAITNATRHAAPRRVQVRLRWERPSVVLQVHDDGHGFDPAAVPPAGRGMASMRERLSLVDGALDVRSAKGNGTTVTATVPLEASG